MAKPAHWLVKSEPSTYSFERLVKEGETRWDGVRNFTARNNLRAMKRGDALLFYHSGEGKAVVGLAKVVREAYPDPTSPDEDWSAVDVGPVRALARPVTLAEMREHRTLGKMVLFKQGRLSVVPVTEDEYRAIVDLGSKRT